MGMNPGFIDSLVAELRANWPGQFAGEAEKNLRAALRAALGRLDLVTREEFEIQSQVLARTRERLEALEKEITKLEQRLAEK